VLKHQFGETEGCNTWGILERGNNSSQYLFGARGPFSRFVTQVGRQSEPRWRCREHTQKVSASSYFASPKTPPALTSLVCSHRSLASGFAYLHQWFLRHEYRCVGCELFMAVKDFNGVLAPLNEVLLSQPKCVTTSHLQARGSDLSYSCSIISFLSSQYPTSIH